MFFFIIIEILIIIFILSEFWIKLKFKRYSNISSQYFSYLFNYKLYFYRDNNLLDFS